MSPPPETVSWRAAVALVLALGALLFAVRLAGPPDLTDNDQEGPTAYVLDVLQNGHWLVQRDAHGEIASKPPFYTWLVSLVALAAGRLNRFTLYLPCAVAVVGTALLVLRAGGLRFGLMAGWMAGFSILFCQFGIKHVALARTDAVFMGTVALGALAAFKAWESGRGWTAFWIAAAAASLTKGPLGLVLAGGGLLATLWGTNTGAARSSWHRVASGAALYALIVGGWFALAYLQVGEALTEKQVGRELMGHLSGASAGGHWPGSQPFHPVAYFLARYAPWSLLALVGLWRVCRRPDPDAGRRRFERFLFCWFFTGLLIFVVAPHKRADLLLPLIPAAALLAGRELARLTAHVRPILIWRGAAVLGLLMLAAVPILTMTKVEAAEVTTQTRAMKAMAAWIRTHVPAGVPITFAGNAMTLQFYLNRHQFHTDAAQAARLLTSDAGCLVATADLDALKRSLPSDFRLYELAHEPPDQPASIYLVSNRSRPSIETVMAVGIGPLSIQLANAVLNRAGWFEFDLRPVTAFAQATITSHSVGPPVSPAVRWQDPATTAIRQRTLAPGETWTVSVAALSSER